MTNLTCSHPLGKYLTTSRCPHLLVKHGLSFGCTVYNFNLTFEIKLISIRFNAKNRIPAADATLHAFSRRYGKETLMDTSPNYKPDGWTTNFRSTIQSPNNQHKGNWKSREPSGGIRFDQDSVTADKKDRFYNSSGFFQNSMICDGKLFVTEKNLHTDIVRTAYRNQFNQEKPFHKTETRFNIGKLRRRELVYDAKDFHGPNNQ